MSYEITSIEDIGNDVLLVRAETENGEQLEVRGHVSATRNHYDDDQYVEYDEDDVANEDLPIGTVGRHLKPDAKSRTMTPKEIGDYARRLIEEAFPPEVVPVPIAFE